MKTLIKAKTILPPRLIRKILIASSELVYRIIPVYDFEIMKLTVLINKIINKTLGKSSIAMALIEKLKRKRYAIRTEKRQMIKSMMNISHEGVLFRKIEIIFMFFNYGSKIIKKVR